MNFTIKKQVRYSSFRKWVLCHKMTAIKKAEEVTLKNTQSKKKQHKQRPSRKRERMSTL